MPDSSTKKLLKVELQPLGRRTEIKPGRTLLEEAHIGPEELDEFIIAGAFGTYIHVESAIHTKMFPDLPLNRFHQIGNGAGEGAKQLLISAQAWKRCGFRC
jgi:uncharacterized 2Fe-2S/4Fe-4S cluster protein (DUF4445 family)